MMALTALREGLRAEAVPTAEVEDPAEEEIPELLEEEELEPVPLADASSEPSSVGKSAM